MAARSGHGTRNDLEAPRNGPGVLTAVGRRQPMPAESSRKRRTAEAGVDPWARPSSFGPVQVDAFSWAIGAL